MHKNQADTGGEWICRVPATSANLGPAFDVAGIALGLWLQVKVRTAPTHSKQDPRLPNLELSMKGENCNAISLDENNLIVQSILYLIYRMRNPNSQSRDKFSGCSLDLLEFDLKLEIENEIPLSRGLGSSASAIVAGIMIANKICSFGLSKDQLFRYVLELENHPDNVGACLFGGFVLGYVSPSKGIEDNNKFGGYLKLEWNPSIKAVCLVPEFQLSTMRAREALPEYYSKADVIHNLQRATILTQILSKDDNSLIDLKLWAEMFEDRLHEPYRLPLIPGAQQVFHALGRKKTPTETCDIPDGLVGVAISGAGPTLISLALGDFDDIAWKMKQVFDQHQRDTGGSISCRTFVLDISNQGAYIEKND